MQLQMAHIVLHLLYINHIDSHSHPSQQQLQLSSTHLNFAVSFTDTFHNLLKFNMQNENEQNKPTIIFPFNHINHVADGILYH